MLHLLANCSSNLQFAKPEFHEKQGHFQLSEFALTIAVQLGKYGKRRRIELALNLYKFITKTGINLLGKDNLVRYKPI